MDLLNELKSIPENEKSLDIFFKISNGIGNISEMGAVSCEIFELNDGSFIQEVSIRATDFDKEDIASRASFLFLNENELEELDEEELDEVELERSECRTVEALIELLELNRNEKIEKTIYTYKKSATGYIVPEIIKLEKSNYSFFGELIDCYIIS